MTQLRRHITAHALARLLGDWRDGPGPLHARLSRRVRQLLAGGRVAPGVRLPAERPLAQRLGVSRTTVARTYATLREQGVLESRRGAGSVTRLNTGSVERFVPWAGGPRLPASPPRLIDLTRPSPAADQAVIAALQSAAERSGELLGHHGYHPLGLPSLRAAIAARYEEARRRRAPRRCTAPSRQ